MAHGLQLFGASQQVQLTESEIVPYKTAGGYAPTPAVYTSVELPCPFDVMEGGPFVLVRPDTADKYIGGWAGGWSESLPGLPPRALCALKAQSGFHWAIYSTTGTALEDSTNYGLAVYRADGSVVYSSKRKYARLRKVYVITPAALTSASVTISISGFTSFPWFVANELPITMAGVGEFTEQVPNLCAKVSADLSSITISWLDDAFAPLNPSIFPYNSLFWAGNFTVSLYEMEEV